MTVYLFTFFAPSNRLFVTWRKLERCMIYTKFLDLVKATRLKFQRNESQSSNRNVTKTSANSLVKLERLFVAKFFYQITKTNES